MNVRLFTSESVTEGHPDKISDQISDAILDAILEKDANARVACEVLVTTDLVHIAGEITTTANVNIKNIVRKTIKEIGYNNPDLGFDGNSCKIIVSLKKQSSDISIGVDNALESRNNIRNAFDKIGAGDQGMMFGYACNETDTLIPMPIYLAHKLTKRLSEVRKNKILPYLRPDGKAQVTVEYIDGSPYRIRNVVISAQHEPSVSVDTLNEDLIKHVIKYVIPKHLLDDKTEYFINPTGRFVIGGPQGDCGLTGRKIIVDTYGGYSSHGGGAFSGKDPTKVDRSAAYMARYISKNIVAAGIADKCEIEVSYAIGIANPVGIMANTFGTGKISDNDIIELIKKYFDLRPAAIIKNLNLKQPIYKTTAAYGHFGRDDILLPWENTDRATLLKERYIG